MNDYIQNNQYNWHKLPQKHKEEFRNGNIYNYSKIYRFVCVECGERVTSLTCNFYKWQLDKFKCYDCQKNNK